MNASTISYIIIGLLGVLWVWFKNKTKRRTIPVLLLLLGIFALYYVLDALFHTEIFSPFTFHKNGFTTSFVGIFLWIMTSFLAAYMVQRYIDKTQKK